MGTIADDFLCIHTISSGLRHLCQCSQCFTVKTWQLMVWILCNSQTRQSGRYLQFIPINNFYQLKMWKRNSMHNTDWIQNTNITNKWHLFWLCNNTRVNLIHCDLILFSWFFIKTFQLYFTRFFLPFSLLQTFSTIFLWPI